MCCFPAEREPKDNPESHCLACCAVLSTATQCFIHNFSHCSWLDFDSRFISFLVQTALKAKSPTTELYLMTFRVFCINQTPIAVVAIFMQQWTSQIEWVQRKHCYNLVPCIPSSLTGRNVVFLPCCGFVNIFSAPVGYISTFSLSTKDNIDMSLHLQFRELTDWIMDHNELSLPLWGQWNPLFRLRNRKEKESTSPGNC